jgi:hypothetical protein
MQTFLPYPSFAASAIVLDSKRLGKQRVETKQIYTALTTGKGWIHHPATKMWAGHESALAYYGIVVCHEWVRRGYNDSLLPYFSGLVYDDTDPPPWFGDDRFHDSHKSNLYRKDPVYYKAFADVGPDLPYYWPTKEDYAYMLDNKVPA